MNSYGRVFKKAKPVMSVKTVVGESRAAAANLEAVHAALTLSGKLPAKQEAYVFENGKAVKTTIDTTDYRYMLVTSFAAGGSYTAVVLKKAD